MAVAVCAGARCQRLISISAIPGGNPVALADPERWATKYVRCQKCGKFFCDRCLKKLGGVFARLLGRRKCSACGGSLSQP
jgi:hypothetical protein